MPVPTSLGHALPCELSPRCCGSPTPHFSRADDEMTPAKPCLTCVRPADTDQPLLFEALYVVYGSANREAMKHTPEQDLCSED